MPAGACVALISGLLAAGCQPAAAPDTLRLAVKASGSNAVISVSDDGPGIDPAELERIFEPFERVGAGRGPDDGAGLGLAIARQLARRHDAELSVDSMPGDGATFRLRLPLMAERSAGSS